MENKNLKWITTCHMILMVIMAIISFASIVILLGVKSLLPEAIVAVSKDMPIVFISYVLVLVFTFLSLVCGIIYIKKGYTKQAAVYYKAFLVFTVLSNVISACAVVLYQGFDLAFVFKIIKTILLLVLIFYKDMGERNTWIIFALAIAFDLVYDLFFDVTRNGMIQILILTVTRLLTMGTIGLAIRGKYEDKHSRGSK